MDEDKSTHDGYVELIGFNLEEGTVEFKVELEVKLPISFDIVNS